MRPIPPILARIRGVTSSVRGAHQNDLGFSLVEQLVALAIMSTAIVVLLAGLMTAARGISLFADRVTAQSLARSQLEMIKDSPYIADPTANPYPAVSAPAAYTLTTSVEYWDSASETFRSAVQNDGMQRITVEVNRAGNQILSVEDYKVDR